MKKSTLRYRQRLSLRKTLWLMLFACAISAALMAQSSNGSMSGTVTDPNGAAVPAVKVIAKNPASGIKVETRTSDAGLYVFPRLPVGAYDIEAEKIGFKRLNHPAVEIRIASRQELDLKLEVGDVQQTVQVTAEAPLLETTSSQRGQGLSPQLLNTLPFFAGGIRGARGFIPYMPGANQTNT